MTMKPRVRATGHCRSMLVVLSVFAIVFAFSATSWATLGEDAGSIECNRAKLQAKLQVQRRSKYAVHELHIPSGGKVRQFIADGGKVFGVTWSGGWRPDLRELMGSHYERYITAMKGKRMTRGPVRIELPGLVLIMGGHQRAFFGRVYLLDRLPSEMRWEDIY